MSGRPTTLFGKIYHDGKTTTLLAHCLEPSVRLVTIHPMNADGELMNSHTFTNKLPTSKTPHRAFQPHDSTICPPNLLTAKCSP
jgi:hypothetical protein